MSKQDNDVIADDEVENAFPDWLADIKAQVMELRYYPNCKLGDGFVPDTISSPTGCIFICPVDDDTDTDEAALDLEKAKEYLAREEPCAEAIMTLLIAPDSSIDKAQYEKRDIHCFDNRQLRCFAKEFFSEVKERIRLGKAGYLHGMYDYAFNQLASVDVGDDADAQFIIGKLYAQGKGTRKNMKKAEEWYWKAAIQGHAEAALELEKGINRETANLKRKEQELIDELEEFTRKLLEEDE